MLKKKQTFKRQLFVKNTILNLIPGCILFFSCVLLTPGLSLSFSYSQKEDRIILVQTQTVDVPGLIGMEYNRTVIDNLLRNSGLRLGTIQNIPDNTRRGQIIRQNPAEGSVVPFNSFVNLYVAVQQPVSTLSRIVVPDLVGKTEQEAREVLERINLGVGDIREIPANDEPGLVVRHIPGAQTIVEPRTEVNLYVSVSELVEVPNLINKRIEEARELIIRANLRIGDISEERSRRNSIGVVEQSIPPGTRVEPRTILDIVYAVSSHDVLVPDVTGISINKARSILADSGLPIGNILEKKSDEQPGIVLSQSPKRGEFVPEGTEMKLVIAAPNTSIFSWIFGGIGIVVVLLSGGVILQRTRGKGRRHPGANEPKPILHPVMDTGKQNIRIESSQLHGPKIQFRAIPDMGVQKIKNN